MDVLVKILQFLLSLSILVMLHEMGHFFMAKLFKVRVEKFFIFFNPWFSIFRFKKGETEYGMGWLPLGGYVKISGMIDESMDLEQMKEPPKPYEFRSKPAWQRLLIMIGGVLVNFLLAFFIYIMVLYTWGEEYLPAENVKYGVVCDSIMLDAGVRNGDIVLSFDNKKVERFSDIMLHLLLDEPKTMQVLRDERVVSLEIPPTLVKKILAYSSNGFDQKALLAPRYKYNGEIVAFAQDAPARNAGMLATDTIIEVDGRGFTYYDEFQSLVMNHRDSVMNVRVLRGQDTLTLYLDMGDSKLMGIQPRIIADFEFAVKKYSFLESVPAGINMGVDKVKSYLKQFKLFENAEAFKSLGGFVSIGNVFPSVWDWHAFWDLTAFLSLILGVMNLLPIPALDGGHVVFLLYEVITRRKPNEKFMENAQIGGMFFLIFLLLFANINDILKLIGIY
ncbi:RIP metalloprotease RseP [Butyricimonas hominis]|uniref:RIP metalloprotease RseP n=1 Tax=Butyricimonas hominis TaxID=2763032 RepID=UPI003514F26B